MVLKGGGSGAEVVLGEVEGRAIAGDSVDIVEGGWSDVGGNWGVRIWTSRGGGFPPLDGTRLNFTRLGRRETHLKLSMPSGM